jgi:hypothetical protein
MSIKKFPVPPTTTEVLPKALLLSTKCLASLRVIHLNHHLWARQDPSFCNKPLEKTVYEIKNRNPLLMRLNYHRSHRQKASNGNATASTIVTDVLITPFFCFSNVYVRVQHPLINQILGCKCLNIHFAIQMGIQSFDKRYFKRSRHCDFRQCGRCFSYAVWRVRGCPHFEYGKSCAI